MKIRRHEHDGLFEALSELGIASSEIKMWKKKGWVYIEIEARNEILAFHRTDHFKISGNKFVSTVDYQMRVNGSLYKKLDWDEVLSRFKQWLIQTDNPAP